MPTTPDESGLPIKVVHVIDWANTVIELKEGVQFDHIRRRLRERGYYPETIEKWIRLAQRDTDFTRGWSRESLAGYLEAMRKKYQIDVKR